MYALFSNYLLMGLEKIQPVATNTSCPPWVIDFTAIETKEKIALAMSQRLYWSVWELEDKWVFASQDAWNRFKLTREFSKYLVPWIVKWVLISKHITP